MRIAGIDPGISGGIFCICETGSFCRPFFGLNSVLCIHPIQTFIDEFKPEHVFIEKPFLNGLEGGQSAMTIGSNYGRLTALLDLNNIPYTEVPPKVWQRALGVLGGSRAATKDKAAQLAITTWNKETFILGKARKPHSGMIDAACIALYGVQSWTKKLSTENTQSSALSLETPAKSSNTSRSKKSSQKPSSKRKPKK
jgi:Holliday junction resolvasome RuvABC endonuclease subunit